MSRKITIEIVRNKFLEEGYELLESEYKNAKTKMKYKCPEGHIHEITWNNFQRGKRCPDCANDKLRQERRHDEKKVIEAFEKEGYTIIGEYFNSRTPIEYICPQGHKHECSYDNWKKGNRCPECCRNIWSLEKAKEYYIKSCNHMKSHMTFTLNCVPYSLKSNLKAVYLMFHLVVI